MDFSSGGNSAQINATRDRVQKELGWNGGSCVQLDKLIKDIRDYTVAERIKPSPYNYGLTKGIYFPASFYIQALVDQKAVLELMFATNDCPDKIEKLRLNESAVLITKKAIEQEKAVLKPANTEQRIYIGVGALILLVGLYIIVKKNSYEYN
jgi:hypothetical protein